jgi:hypothetical protein
MLFSQLLMQHSITTHIPIHLTSFALISITSLALTLGPGVCCGVESTGTAPGKLVNCIPGTSVAGGAKGSGAESPVGNPTATLITVGVPFTVIVVAVFDLEAREQ